MFSLVGLSHLSQADAPDAVATAWDITSASRTPAGVQWCLRGAVCWPFVFSLVFCCLLYFLGSGAGFFVESGQYYSMNIYVYII